MTENVSYLLNLLLDDPGADGLGTQADQALGQKLPQVLVRESPESLKPFTDNGIKNELM